MRGALAAIRDILDEIRTTGRLIDDDRMAKALNGAKDSFRAKA